MRTSPPPPHRAIATAALALVLLGALVCRAQNAPSSNPAPATPGEKASEVVTLPAFDVVADRDLGYLSANAESATRLNAAISDIPQSITVFNQQFLSDIGALEIRDVADYDPSFTMTNEVDQFTARGFGGTAATIAGGNYFNGFPQSGSFGSQTIANVDRVEVLRGPAAVLYGSGAFGGTINRISKKPLDQRQTTVRTQINSNALWTTTLDTTGPIDFGPLRGKDGPKFAYRLNALWADGDDFRDLPRGDRMIAPTLSWAITPKTKLILDYVYSRETRVGNWETPIQGGHPGYVIVGNGTVRPVDFTHFLGASTDRRQVNRHLGYVDFRHEFSRHLLFRSMFNLELKDTYLNEVLPDSTRLVITATTALVPRQYRSQDQDTDNWRSRNELVADFTTGPAHHRLILGQAWDMQKDQLIRLTTAANNGPNFLADRFPPADLFDYVPGPLPSPMPPLSLSVFTISRAENYSWYASDLTSLFRERLFLQGGIRQIRSDRTSLNRITNAPSTKSWEEATTGSSGFVYHLRADKSLSLFGNYNGTFVPNFTVNPDGSELPSMKGNQKEFGVKYALGRRLSGLVTYYDIRQSNVPVLAPELGSGWRKVIDGLRSKGAEINFNANLTPGWSIFGGYTYTDAKGSPTGTTSTTWQRHFRAPVDAVSLFNKYSFREGPLKRLSLSGGLVWRSDSLPQPLSSPRVEAPWKVPPYLRVDAIVAYSFKINKVSYSASLKVRNLTDKMDNYINAVSTLRGAIESGRETTLSVTAKF